MLASVPLSWLISFICVIWVKFSAPPRSLNPSLPSPNCSRQRILSSGDSSTSASRSKSFLNWSLKLLFHVDMNCLIYSGTVWHRRVRDHSDVLPHQEHDGQGGQLPRGCHLGALHHHGPRHASSN